jgi:hypothetical protein
MLGVGGRCCMVDAAVVAEFVGVVVCWLRVLFMLQGCLMCVWAGGRLLGVGSPCCVVDVAVVAEFVGVVVCWLRVLSWWISNLYNHFYVYRSSNLEICI